MSNNGFEIERKFLIRYPDEAFLKQCSICYHIEQVYLLTDQSGYSSRIRKRESDEGTEFFHTRKKHITDIRREEIETLITEAEYLNLLRSKDPDRSIIYKSRFCHMYCGKMFELDIYPFWNDRALLEIELSDESEEFFIPEELTIIREVTNDPRYTNSSLARSIPQDNIEV